MSRAKGKAVKAWMIANGDTLLPAWSRAKRKWLVDAWGHTPWGDYSIVRVEIRPVAPKRKHEPFCAKMRETAPNRCSCAPKRKPRKSRSK